MTEIEEKALALRNAVLTERGLSTWGVFKREESSVAEALCRAIEQLEAERTAHAATKAEAEAFRREVSDAVEECCSEHLSTGEFHANSIRRFILAKPIDPLVALSREMTLLDGVVRTDSQKAAIREGRAGNTASDDFYDRLRAAFASCSLEVRPIGENAA